jgi:glycerol-3-phosphate dehydrogenase (NAD(P)+)
MGQTMRAGVVGAGAWGSALADQLAKKGHQVSLWCFESEVADAIASGRVNEVYLPGHALHHDVTPTTDLLGCVRGKDVVVVAVPSHHVRSIAQRIGHELGRDTLLVSASKGIENESLMTMSGVYSDALEINFHKNYSVLSGPSFAIEVAKGMPTAVTVAAWDHRTAKRVQEIFSSTYFRCYTSTDVIGVELGGALKNVVAIAVGAVDGMGFGHNTRAGLMTRALSQIARIGVPLGASPLTLSGLSGAGDLILTCTGDLSRNRTFGYRLGKGESVEAILSGQPQVVEGYLTSKSAYHLIRQLGVEAAIFEQIYLYLHENEDRKPIAHFVHNVMSRELKPEL